MSRRNSISGEETVCDSCPKKLLDYVLERSRMMDNGPWRAQQPAHPEHASDQPTRLKWWARVRRHPLIFYPAIVVTVVMVVVVTVVMAVIAFGQAFGLEPDDPVSYYNRGTAYAHKGDYDQAIKDYDQALRLKPDYAEAYTNRGAVYANKGNYDQAIKDFDQALRLKPDDAMAYFG